MQVGHTADVKVTLFRAIILWWSAVPLYKNLNRSSHVARE